MGDSFAEHLLPLLNVAGRETTTAIALVVPCPAVFDDATLRRYWPERPLYNQQCAVNRAETLRFLAEHHDIRTVILASPWASLLDLLQGNDGDRLPRSEGIGLIAGALDRLLGELSAPGRRVVLFADPPRVPVTDPAACSAARVSPLLRDCPPDMGVLAWKNLQALLPTHRMLAEVGARHANTTVYFPEDHLCSDGRCAVEVNGEFLYRDTAHLRRNLTPETLHALVERLRLADLLRSAGAADEARP